mmetsp:Transcript_46154/g.100258  ORF Transcript_46154/g.100258 Transcript_46154/m.100258 type:complete len:201 (+) Transcript_46154:1071-1673(+)
MAMDLVRTTTASSRCQQGKRRLSCTLAETMRTRIFTNTGSSSTRPHLMCSAPSRWRRWRWGSSASWLDIPRIASSRNSSRTAATSSHPETSSASPMRSRSRCRRVPPGHFLQSSGTCSRGRLPPNGSSRHRRSGCSRGSIRGLPRSRHRASPTSCTSTSWKTSRRSENSSRRPHSARAPRGMSILQSGVARRCSGSVETP